jgi:hypothetical protein
MELPARSLSNYAFIISIFLSGCGTHTPKQLVLNNVDSVSVVSSKGILYVNDTVYSGILFSLLPQTSDTASVRMYRNGKEDGVHRELFQGGRLKSVRSFNSGKKEGLYEAWWENGRKRLEYNFGDDEYNGSCKEWTEEGVMIRKMNYRNGHENGLQQAWDTNGKPLANYEARNGRNYGLTGVKECATLWKKDSVRAH